MPARRRPLAVLVALACLALWPQHAPAQSEPWERLKDAGAEAYQEGNYAEAERQYAAALKAAEGFGREDPRLAQSLNGLAEVYRAQGKYAESWSHHRRALTIREKARGPDHPAVAETVSAHGTYREAAVVEDGELVTSRGPGTAFQFALALVARLVGQQRADSLRGPMMLA